MTITSRLQQTVSIILCAWFLAALPRTAWAAWGPDPVAIRSTQSTLPSIQSCSDGGYGAFVVWQDDSDGLRAQHVLATGDLDPAWPSAGAPVSNIAGTRNVVGAVADRLGGVFVAWVYQQTFYVSRIVAGGGVAPGWPVNGTSYGPGAPGFCHVMDDGNHGVYLAVYENVFHVGPDGHGTAGWPEEGVALPVPATDAGWWPRLAPAPAGDCYVGWGSVNFQAQGQGSWRLLRLTAGGLPASGWPNSGVALGAMQFGQLLVGGFDSKARLLDLSPDGRGGVFMATVEPKTSSILVRLLRIGEDGVAPADWPAAGLTATWGGNHYVGGTYYLPAGTDEPYARVCSDGDDGALLGIAGVYFTDSPPQMLFNRAMPPGQFTASSAGYADWIGVELAARVGSGAYVGTIEPSGPTTPATPPASVAVQALMPPTGWVDWGEWSSLPVAQRYGDISLLAIPDGGAMLFWSQYIDRHGVFATRFGAAGLVTGVASSSSAAGVRQAWFARGVGVRARVSLPTGAAASLQLFDVAGRRRASGALSGGGEREATLAGTEGLRGGVYFLTTQIGDRRYSNRVVVIP